MTTTRQPPNHTERDDRGTPGTSAAADAVPARPARDQLTAPISPDAAVMPGSDAASEPTRANGPPPPVRGDAPTERMGGQENAMPAHREQHARRARPTAPPAHAPGQPVAGTRIGQYELIRSLGRGGMGEVYLARDLRLGRLVAIKRLSAPGPGLAERFLHEARTTARCTHENIVIIHEVGEADED